MDFTTKFIVFTTLFILLVDGLLLYTKYLKTHSWPEALANTISDHIAAWGSMNNWKGRALVFAFGFLMGHFFG